MSFCSIDLLTVCLHRRLCLAASSASTGALSYSSNFSLILCANWMLCDTLFPCRNSTNEVSSLVFGASQSRGVSAGLSALSAGSPASLRNILPLNLHLGPAEDDEESTVLESESDGATDGANCDRRRIMPITDPRGVVSVECLRGVQMASTLLLRNHAKDGIAPCCDALE
eukprot:CAMPEP_0173439986 /NCGR_PEP_ID=MMETSP1357-20121228/22029_1 /TAXON_ID=77926 /ORGANISM="Hemiselmis rufescens, Strain PCC563" /LENGTH=169 /DNA_ID=CAMNT_0014405417 /DNA_START=198 /DNA_END=704 /DNA_ORIENTATION=-